MGRLGLGTNRPMSSSVNLAVRYLKDHGETLEEYDGFCGELVDAIIHWMGEQRVRIMYLKGDCDGIGPDCCWSYHMVPVIDGRVHDAWFPALVVPPDEYLLAAFPGQDPEVSFYGE